MGESSFSPNLDDALGWTCTSVLQTTNCNEQRSDKRHYGAPIPSSVGATHWQFIPPQVHLT
jgi:hypothetical protein